MWYTSNMFLDKVTITIKAGNGGNGHVSFYRDALTARGGPDGGDGGRGGDIIFIGTTRVDNLVDFRFAKKFFANDGKPGGKRHCTGKSAEPMLVPVPLGTKVYKITRDSDSSRAYELLADITEPDQQYVALRGGAGGRGNAFYATAKKQTPNFSQMGVITKEHQVRLELNTIADIGLVGFPNVGKSTLLKSLTRSRPKIANYHFTTLHPNVGVAEIHGKRMVIADIPGLIKGAGEGIGLGHDFLKHIRRTRALIHVVDISEQEGRTATDDYRTINAELKTYNPDLATKPQIIALNKCDIATPSQIQKFKKALKSAQVFEIVAATAQGTRELLNAAFELLQKVPKAQVVQPTATLEEGIDKNAFTVEVSGDEFHVTGPLVDNLIRGIVLTDTESNAYFQRRLIESGIIDELKRLGMTTGSSVNIGEIEFEWED